MRLTTFLSLTVVLLTGCAPASKGPPTFGERLQAQGRELATIGEKWSRGQELVEEGKEAIQEGEALIAKGRQRIQRGEAMIERGKQLMQDAEQEYQEHTGAATIPLTR